MQFHKFHLAALPLMQISQESQHYDKVVYEKVFVIDKYLHPEDGLAIPLKGRLASLKSWVILVDICIKRKKKY